MMSNVTEGWSYKEEWKRGGEGFLVVISRHSVGEENRWCVYLYVYDIHPAFDLFNPDAWMFDQPNFDCHSYVSLFNTHRRNDGRIASFQLGWDYNHDGDWQYAQYATADDAASVFLDAGRLFDQAAAWQDGEI